MTRDESALRGKVVLVTGGARGIGAAVAAELARRGATPVLADVDKAGLADTAAAIPGCGTVELDVTDYAACQRAVATVLDMHGRLDIVWANAGIGAGGPMELVEPRAWTRVIEVNLIGAFNTVRAALDEIIKARGYVAITASLASFGHAPGLSAYSASKAGVEAMADSLRIEVAHLGVDVGVLHPSWIGTDMVAEGDGESPSFRRLRQAMRGPLSRTHPVESIVGPIADGFAARKQRIFLPGFVRLAFVARSMLHTKFMLRDQLKAAPEIRNLFAAQAEQQGVHDASMPTRWR